MPIIGVVSPELSRCYVPRISPNSPNNLFGGTHREGPAATAAGLGIPAPTASAETEEGSRGTACLRCPGARTS